jgi:hypothetical protein
MEIKFNCLYILEINCWHSVATVGKKIRLQITVNNFSRWISCSEFYYVTWFLYDRKNILEVVLWYGNCGRLRRRRLCTFRFRCLTLVLDDGSLYNFDIIFLDTKGRLVLNLEFVAPPILELGAKKGQLVCFHIFACRVFIFYCILMWFITFSC